MIYILILSNLALIVMVLILKRTKKRNDKFLKEMLFFIEATLREVTIAGDNCSESSFNILSENDDKQCRSMAYVTVIRNLEAFRKASDSLLFVVNSIKSNIC